jgi:ankyrin repeat protein
MQQQQQRVYESLSLHIQAGDKQRFVAALEEMRFDVNYQSVDNRNTLLHVACQNGNKLMVKNVLRVGAKMNLQNSRGNTAIHFCFAYGYAELGQYLISKGADDSILNADGLSAYEGLRKEELDRM